MIVIKQEKLELEEKVMELTKKMEIHEKKVAEFKFAMDLLYEMVCGYSDSWNNHSSTVTYERLSADYTKADRPGGGDRQHLLHWHSLVSTTSYSVAPWWAFTTQT